MGFDISNIINAANYESFCEYSIIPPEGKLFNSDMLNCGGTIFCKTDYIDYLFDNIKKSNFKYNLITHHSDYPIDEERYNKKPECIHKWYGINTVYDGIDLINIPLGVKTHSGIYLETQYMTEWFADNIDRLIRKEKHLNVYCNWNITNINRNNVLDTLNKNDVKCIYDTNLPFYNYIENMANNKFVISPPGNGIDCHRTWEALYIGCYPIVIKNKIYDNLEGLPILQVNDYNEVNMKMLEDFSDKKFSYEKLYVDYWKNLIKR